MTAGKAPEQVRPQEGPQERFLSCDADICIYGGAAGGGKSWALLMEAARHLTVPGYSGVIFRKTSPDIRNEGGLWDTSTALYPGLGFRGVETRLLWRHERYGTSVRFAHMQHESDKLNWQGAQVPFIGFDELTHFSRTQFFYLLSRNRSVCGVRPYIRASCNPEPDSWVRELIAWWIGPDGTPVPERDGVVRWFIRGDGDAMLWFDSLGEVPAAKRRTAKSLTFIAASLADNKILMEKDPQYLANLQALPAYLREQLLGGNWDIKPAAGDYFKREWFRVVEPGEVPEGGEVVRYWDRAATEATEKSPDPDWTVGLKVKKVERAGFVEYYILDLVRGRWRPQKVEAVLENTASQDSAECVVWLEEDPGQAGKADIDNLKRRLHKYAVKACRVTSSKEVRARPASAAAEQGRIHVVRGDWNAAFFGELEQFPDGAHDDQVDTLSGAYNALTNLGIDKKRPGLRVLRR